MTVWVFYDISKNKVRNKISKLCLQIGLKRMQKSIFLGKVRRREIERFRKEVNKRINFQTDKVFILPVAPRNLKRMRRLGQPTPLPKLKTKGKVVFY